METYIFNNPGKVRIRSRIDNHISYCDINTDIWQWLDGGDAKTLDWRKYNFNTELKEVFKAFIFHRLESLSPQSVRSSDIPFLNYIENSNQGKVFPLPESIVIMLLIQLSQKNIPAFFGFKKFYQWATERKIRGFTKMINDKINEIKPPKRNQYQHIFLNPTFITDEEETKIIRHIKETELTNSYKDYRNNVLLHIAFELAPRPIQCFSISQSDIEAINHKVSNETFYTLWLPMAKKVSSAVFEKRPRSIGKYLGIKLFKLIEFNKKYSNVDDALFIDVDSEKLVRLSGLKIGKIIVDQLASMGFDKGKGAIILRHHLAQSLANQGAPADIIAEILGHNSTLPARAYVAATPEIATIKTKALGKSKTYENIMKMLLTGEIIEKDTTSKDRWVKGMVGNQYIGGIGSCGLPNNTACPKNPIYSCYTCHKFHPFADGNHQEVKKGLQRQAQYFIDIAEKAMDLEHNRPVVQLEKTIEAVDAVIERCKATITNS